MENLASPIMSDNYDKFHDRLPDEEVRLTEKIAGDELEYFGYELVNSRDQLEEVEPDPERYSSLDKKLRRNETLRDWRDSPRESSATAFSRSQDPRFEPRKVTRPHGSGGRSRITGPTGVFGTVRQTPRNCSS